MRNISRLIVKIVLGILILSSSAVAQTPYLPSAYSGGVQPNYIKSIDALAPESNAANLLARPIKDAKVTTAYFDGLGRPLQTVIKKGSLESSTGANTDFVIPVIYDVYGREKYKFLPFTHAGNDGSFKLDPFGVQKTFYDAQLSGQGDSWYYGQINFESSPLNRPEIVMPPGSNWSGGNRGVGSKYWMNTANDDVKKWEVTDVADNWGTYAVTGTYSPNEFFKLATVDEHGKQSIEFRDKEGKVILKKLQLTAAADNGLGSGYPGWLCTYYVYDGFNNLRLIIQPKGVELLIQNGWNINALGGDILNEQSFRYEYDERKRVIMKKNPGSEELWIVYDGLGRMILTQDGNLRSQGKWMYCQFDNLGRAVATGLWTNGQNRIFHKGQSANSTNYPNLSGQIYEELTNIFYDSYNWRSLYGNPLSDTRNTSFDSYFLAPSNSVWPYPQTVSQSSNLKGLATGSRIKVLNSNPVKYIYSIPFYDNYGRVIQVQSTNITNGTDIITTQYSWSDRPLIKIEKHEKQGSNAQTTVVLTQISYDDLGRVIKVEKKTKNSLVNGDVLPSVWTIVAEHQYNKLGQLLTKKVGRTKDAFGNYTTNPIETLNYEYNIRGWLLGINRNYVNNVSPTNKFGFELGYDKTPTVMGATTGKSFAAQQFNGNVTGTVWRNAGDGLQRKYDFTYDAINRLIGADFNQYTGSQFDKSAGIDYSVSSLSYDANGNILSMTQKGWKASSSVPIDQLTYNYLPNSNKLLNVIDAANEPQTKLGDFKTSTLHPTQSKTSTTVDYTYDANGNLKRDYNKDLGNVSNDGIVYNHLNLAQTITVRNLSGIKGTITYTYDAGGNKLAKLVTETGKLDKTTIYAGGAIYENDELLFVLHEEGRIRYEKASTSVCPSKPNRIFYDYFIKDHLGNTRIVLTEQQESICYIPATVEDATWNTEKDYYAISDTRRISKSTVAGAENIASFGQKIYRTNGGGSATEKTGLGIIIKVMAGDQVKITGESYYNLPGGNAGPPLALAVNDLISALLGSPGLPAQKVVSTSDINNIPGNTSNLGTFISNNTPGSNTAKAYINWILLDEQLKYVSGDKDPVIANGGYKNHTLFINNPVNVTKNGYVYVFVSNESNLSVYFDNLNITHIRGSILETTDYYPFGLTMANISARASLVTQNLFKFNSSSEFNGDLDVNLYETTYRGYDPQIGRFHQMDQLSDSYNDESPYSFALNNPIYCNDPLGLEGTPYFNNVEELLLYIHKNGISSFGTGFTRYIFGADGETESVNYDPNPRFSKNKDGVEGLWVTFRYSVENGYSEEFRHVVLGDIVVNSVFISAEQYLLEWESYLGYLEQHEWLSNQYDAVKKFKLVFTGAKIVMHTKFSPFLTKLTGKEGWWLGKNLKFNRAGWGGNGYTGARSIARATSKGFGLASKVLGAGTAVISGIQAYNDFSHGNTKAGIIHSADAAMAIVGLFPPLGTAISTVYFISRLFWGDED